MRRPTAILLGGLVVVVAVALYTQAVRVGAFSPDEEYFVQLARVVADHFPGGVIDVASVPDDNARGLQRLLPIVLAWPLGGMPDELGFRVARALLCLAWASTAVPAFLLARGVGLRERWALAAAALAIVVPWAVLATGILTEPLAYPLSAWALWAAWRACLVATWRADVLALALVVAAGLARTSMLVLAVVAPLAVIAHALASGRRPGQLVRERPLPVALVVLGAGYLLIGPSVGQYNTSLFDVDWTTLPEKFAGQAAAIVVGLGALPAIVGVPWALAHAFGRRASAETRALACVTLVAVPVLFVATIYAAPEERYLVYVVPPVVVCAVAALARRDVPAWAVAVTAVLVAVLVDRQAWAFVGDAGRFQTDPAESTFSRLVVTKLDAAPVAALAALLAGLAVAYAIQRRRAGIAVAALTALVVLQIAQTGYIVDTRADATQGPADLAERTWLGKAAGGEPLAAQTEGLTATAGFEAAWREVAFYNRELRRHVSTMPGPYLLIPRNGSFEQVDVDPRTGALAVVAGRDPLPALWTVTTLYRPIVLAGERPVAAAGYVPVALVRVAEPPAAAWRWTGPDADGWITRAEPRARLETFPGAGRACVRLTFQSAPNSPDPFTIRVTAPGYDERRRTGAEERVTFTVPVARRIAVRTTGSAPFPGDRDLSFQVVETRPVACDGGASQ